MNAIFEISGRLPGLNEIIMEARSSRFASAAQKSATTRFCGQFVVAAKIPVFVQPTRISFVWIEPNRRRDLDNVSGGGTKFILDALVATGRLKNDTREFVRGLVHSFPEPDPKNPRIIVKIEEFNE